MQSHNKPLNFPVEIYLEFLQKIHTSFKRKMAGYKLAKVLQIHQFQKNLLKMQAVGYNMDINFTHYYFSLMVSLQKVKCIFGLGQWSHLMFCVIYLILYIQIKNLLPKISYSQSQKLCFYLLSMIQFRPWLTRIMCLFVFFFFFFYCFWLLWW